MLLVQHPQHIPMSPSLMPVRFNSHNHRRNPSAPAAVVHVQATKVPGLLSLSKPQLQVRSGSVPGKHATPRQPKSKVAPAQATPDSKQRGRGSPAKDKATRSSSKPRAGHGRRAHQPSPPPLQSPTEQVSSLIPTSATDDAATPKASFATLPKASTPSPVLSSPSGRLAKRRNRGVIPFPQIDSSASPTPANNPKQPLSPSPMPAAKSSKPVSAPMAVPQAKKQSHAPEPHPISRSDPVKSSFPRMAHRRAKHGVPSAELMFPVCDDDSDSDRPSTPSPLRSHKKGLTGSSSMTAIFDHSAQADVDGFNNHIGSLTAPSTSVRRTFATSTPSASSSSATRRPSGHKRAPSYPTDSMFNLPFESDSELSSSTSLNFKKIDADTSALFGGLGSVSGGIRRPRLQSASRSASTPNGKLLSGAFAYASSSFQNSPSPEQLPPPSFMFGAPGEAVAPLAA
ncbi:hypothetical protein SCHPADRAFT_394309 [Schizopora paradoxa]|uniref:Uncharacterized protein n=1 Tax=Schizopora paradoxa TaxID=27342 RepID=A0A0H2RMQ3_9AGAM|nr:hypothetical protein SCHPADRAFT_394309 [Schizopora paradoxa]